MPPPTALTAGEVSEATAPARKLPTWGPAAPMTKSTPPTRPRNPSGVASCTIVARTMTLVVSAAPARTSSGRPSHSVRARPNPAMAAPQTVTLASRARPGRTACATGPDSAEPNSPPTAGAAVMSPRVGAAPPKWAALRAGNSANGMPRTIASRSARKTPVRIGPCGG